MTTPTSRPAVQTTQVWTIWLYRLLDCLAIAYGVHFITVVMPEFNSDSTFLSYLVATGLFMIVAEFFGLYRDWSSVNFGKEAGCSILAWTVTVVLLMAIGQYSVYTREFRAEALAVWYLVAPVIALALRITYRSIRKMLLQRGIGLKKYAVVGCNPLGLDLVKGISQSEAFHLQFHGFYEDRDAIRTQAAVNKMPELAGRVEDLIKEVKENRVQVVFISLPMRAEARIQKILAQLADSTASVYIVPDLFVFQLMHSRWTNVQGLPVVSVFENPFYGVDGVFKRGVDLIVGAIALALAAIPMLIVAGAVKLTSKGPVFFKQKRYGLDGKPIDVWKFRSMTVCENGAKVVQATKNDSRLTPIGGFLRKTSLDELPQLFNVLNGTMSLVGPRPHANAHNEFYRTQISGYMLRHKVKPGITGLAQVSGCRGETDTLDKMETRIRFDHQYIREWSLLMDLKIMLKTMFVVLKRENAY
ncbi:MAG: undecaprenyl-phosphate glucose phosphotransferase [Planctomycetaceae bacterium]|nr:undecaprenyl-phosphate glucose phosphotransferase [Planctomycetaceae bacterium]